MNIFNKIEKLALFARKTATKILPEKDSKVFKMIVPGVYWMAYPTKKNIRDIAYILSTTKSTYFRVWNLSEHIYDSSPFDNRVIAHGFPGYPCPPLLAVMEICLQIVNWLNDSQQNFAIIHCTAQMDRTALVASCLMAMMKDTETPVEALLLFCAIMKKNENKILLPSEHMLINYYSVLMRGIKLNHKKLLLQRIMISEIPQIRKKRKRDPEEDFRPYIQIFKGTKIIHNDLTLEKPVPDNYSKKDMSIMITIQTQVEGDFLIRCRHFTSTEARVSSFRLMLNSAFILDEVLRFKKSEIDIGSDFIVSEEFYIDLFFKMESEESTETQWLEDFRTKCQNTKMKTWDESKKSGVFLGGGEEEKEISEDKVLKEDFFIKQALNRELEDFSPGVSEDTCKDIIDPEKSKKIEQFLNSIDSREVEDNDIDDYISNLEQ